MGIPNSEVKLAEQDNDVAIPIRVVCEAASKDYQIEVQKDTKVSEIIDSIKKACKDEGHDVDHWLTKEVGKSSQMALIRKADGNACLSPEATFGDLNVQPNEVFHLAAQPVVA